MRKGTRMGEIETDFEGHEANFSRLRTSHTFS